MKWMSSIETGMIFGIKNQYSLNGCTQGKLSYFEMVLPVLITIPITFLNNKTHFMYQYQDFLSENILQEAYLIVSG